MIRLPKFTTSVYGLLLWRLLLSLAALTFARVVFLLFNTDLLHLGKSALWPAFAGGLRFDLAALVYLNAPMLLMHLLPFRFVERSGWQRAATWVYFIPNLLALAANLADVIYFRFTLNRTTMAVFREFAHDNAWRFLRFPIDYPLPPYFSESSPSFGGHCIVFSRSGRCKCLAAADCSSEVPRSWRPARSVSVRCAADTAICAHSRRTMPHSIATNRNNKPSCSIRRSPSCAQSAKQA